MRSLRSNERSSTPSGGATGIREFNGLESAIAQPRASFGGIDLHPTLAAKASALGYSLALNHPFLDGNKRIAHAAMEVFLTLNGFEIVAKTDEQERLMLDVAAGTLDRQRLEAWLTQHIKPLRG